MKNNTQLLEDWYYKNTDSEWEHLYGISIKSLDNPGWMLEVDLKGTNLENKPFASFSIGVDYEKNITELKWISCKVEDSKFIAAGNSLDHLISEFLKFSN